MAIEDSALPSAETPYTSFYECTRWGSQRGADAIVPLLMQLIQPRSVVDVGCGIGEWLAVFDNHGVSDSLGIDGNWVNRADLVIPLARFLAADLTCFPGIGRRFDLALCLEVAEHLPQECADTFVQLLTSLAPVVLFSAAIPGQAGYDHSNCQWPPYWFRLFAARGFLPYDAIRRHIWRNPSVPAWYQQNCFLFVDRADHRVAQALAHEAPFDERGDLTLVPARQAWYSEPTLRGLPWIAGGAIARSWTHWLGGKGPPSGWRALQRRATRRTRGTTTPDLSVVLCTHDRGAQLKASLEHLSRLRCADSWELVIVDNGSSDDTPDILKRYQAAATFPVVLVHEPKPGLGGARNAGVAASRGDLIAFTDDDCYPRPDWLTHIRHAFADERVGYMGGRILLYDPADAPIAIRTSTSAEWIPPHSLLRAGRLQGANMAVRREVFESAGVFDPLFGSGTSLIADDIEFLARVSAVGWSGLYSPDAVVYHHHRRSHADMDGQSRLYSQGIGAYHTKLLLRRDTRMLGVRHWVASLRRSDLRTFARECNGAAQYVLKRAAVAFRGNGSS